MGISGVNLIKLELTDADARLFTEFRRQQDVWAKLLNSGALTVKNGSVVLHFDNDGSLRRIERHDILLTS